MPVGFHDAADVGLHHGALQHAARLRLDDGCKFGVFYFLVAFEGDAAEHGSFDEMHDQPLAGALDRDLVEQAGCQQCLQRRIACGGVEPPVRRRMEIRAYRVGVDAAIALHGNGAARLRVGLARRRFGSVAALGAETSPSAATNNALAVIDRRHRRPRAMHRLITSCLSPVDGSRWNCLRGAKECLT